MKNPRIRKAKGDFAISRRLNLINPIIDKEIAEILYSPEMHSISAFVRPLFGGAYVPTLADRWNVLYGVQNNTIAQRHLWMG